MKVAPAIGHEVAPGWSVRTTPKPGVPSQSALPAAAWNASALGATVLPSLFTMYSVFFLSCLANAFATYPMEPLVLLTLLATPSLPLVPMPTGHSTAVLAPTLDFQSALTFDR